MTQHERSGLRDEELRLRHAELRLSMPADDMQLSARHRQWGASVPCVNVDFLAVEYSMSRAAALVDYKRFTNPTVCRWLDGATRALVGANEQAWAGLATAAQLPAVIAVYWPQTWAVIAVALNAAARDVFGAWSALSEREWVAWLYRVRSLSLSDPSVVALLNDVKPPRTPATDRQFTIAKD